MQWIVFTIISLLSLITPFIFSLKSSELFEFPKILSIYLGAGLLLPLVFLAFKRNMKSEQKNDWAKVLHLIVPLSVLLFFISQLISTVVSIDRHVSIFGYYSRFSGGLLSVIAYCTIFFAACFYIQKKRITTLLEIVFLGGVGIALWALPSHFGHDFICLIARGSFSTSCWTADFNPLLRIFATLGQPNWLAVYLLIQIFITLYFITTGHRFLNIISVQLSRLILFICFLLFSIEIVWTNSRSGIITYIVFTFLFLVSLFFVSRKFKDLSLSFNQILLIPSVIFLLTTLLYFLPFLQQKFITSRKPVTLSPEYIKEQRSYIITPSSDIRKIVWKGAALLAQKYPLFGTGVETFAYSYNFTRLPAHNQTSEWDFVYNKAHNELFNFLATTGYIGLGTYIVMFLAFTLPALIILINLCLQKKNQHSEGIVFTLCYLCVMGSMFAMNFFGFSTSVTNFFFYLFPALFMVYTKETESHPKNYMSLASGLVYLVYITFVCAYLVSYFRADYNYARSKEYRQMGDAVNAYLYTQKAIALREEPVYLEQQAFLSANLAALYSIQKQPANAGRFASQATSLSLKILNRSPLNVFYWKTATKIYYLLSLSYINIAEKHADYFQKAIEAAEVTESLAPSDPRNFYTHAAMLFENRPDEAKVLLEHALSLKPHYGAAKELLDKIKQ